MSRGYSPRSHRHQVVIVNHILSSRSQSYLCDSVTDASHILADSSQSYSTSTATFLLQINSFTAFTTLWAVSLWQGDRSRKWSKRLHNATRWIEYIFTFLVIGNMAPSLVCIAIVDCAFLLQTTSFVTSLLHLPFLSSWFLARYSPNYSMALPHWQNLAQMCHFLLIYAFRCR
jgi:hypothetical protein